jgi:cbb3-type cytochrome oxidase subunit 3
MSTLPEGTNDPGWPRSLLWVLVPPLAIRRAQRSGDANVLQLLRLLFTSFAMSLVLIGVVVIALADSEPAEADRPAASVVAAGVVAYGALSLFAPRLIERPLDCSDETALVSGYRTRLFLRIAFANAAALIGFVGFFLSGAAWMYPLGAIFAVMGYVRLAPSRRNLERDQEELNQQGCGLSLTGLLVARRIAKTDA